MSEIELLKEMFNEKNNFLIEAFAGRSYRAYLGDRVNGLVLVAEDTDLSKLIQVLYAYRNIPRKPQSISYDSCVRFIAFVSTLPPEDRLLFSEMFPLPGL